MAAEVVTHRFVYLKNPALAKKSRYHNAYDGDGAIHGNPAGGVIYKLTFINGVARNVEDSIYQRFHALGIADLHKPTIEKAEDEI